VPLDAELSGDAATQPPLPQEPPPASVEWQVLERLEKTAIGVRGPEGAATVRRTERPDCWLYGPFWLLHAGHYRLSFSCRADRAYMPRQPVLGVEVIAIDRFQQAWRDYTIEELAQGPQTIDFEVPPVLGREGGEELRFEFRFFHLANADLTIDSASLRRRDTTEPATPPRRWRMLGRLRKLAIGRWGSDGLVVRRSERPGPVLFEAKPYLQLPQGRYRLLLDCRAGRPLMPAQPVVAVEIIAQSRWWRAPPNRWKTLFSAPAASGIPVAARDFTSAELLMAGATELEFTIPPELSLDAGDGSRLQLRILHLGNADLSLRAVDVQSLGAEEDGCAAAPEWRLLGRLQKSRIGARAADRVTVGRSEPAGRLLYGGRPPLHLPDGFYELGFRCRAGGPAVAERPALAVEILAPEPLRREFTRAELQEGEGRIEFTVPVPDARVEVAFSHLGDADLSIDSVAVRKIERLQDCARSTRMRGRSSVIVVGNCQAQMVHIALCRSEPLARSFDTKYHFVNLQKNLHEFGKRELESADIILVQDIKDWENYPLRRDVPEAARIIKFPLLHFVSLWPFDHYNGMGDKEAYEREWPNLTYVHLDGLLGRLRKTIPDPEQRFLAYRDLAVEEVINFHRLHEFESRRLHTLDRKFEIGIADAVLDQFRRQRLFHTTVHPSTEIMSLLMRYLLKCLGVKVNYRPDHDLDNLGYLEVPVHPAVARALGVRWADANTLYRFGGKRITWETYVRSYIAHYG